MTESHRILKTKKENGSNLLSRDTELPSEYINKILCGDNLDLIKTIPSNCINLVITSPPYFKQREYGKGMGNELSFEEYLRNLRSLFHECVRVLKDDGSIVFNIGDKYEDGNLLLLPYRFAIEIIDNEDVKLVNDITWIKLNPTPRQFKRRLVSSTEPFFHFVKTNDYFYNMSAFKNHLDRIKKKINVGKHSSNNIGKKYFQLIENSDLTEIQKEVANEELLAVIEEVNARKIESFRMKIRGIHSPAFGGQEGGRKTQIENKGFTIIKINGNALKKDIIESAVESLKYIKHPAIFPEYIIYELLQLLTKEDDLVLDPYIGSGTTALACINSNRNYIGFEINETYCEEAEIRIKENSPIQTDIVF